MSYDVKGRDNRTPCVSQLKSTSFLFIQMLIPQSLGMAFIRLVCVFSRLFETRAEVRSDENKSEFLNTTNSKRGLK